MRRHYCIFIQPRISLFDDLFVVMLIKTCGRQISPGEICLGKLNFSKTPSSIMVTSFLVHIIKISACSFTKMQLEKMNLFSVNVSLSVVKTEKGKLSHLGAACWGGRSASQKVEHLSFEWLWHYAQSTYWLLLKYSSSNQSSRHCLQREKRQRDGTGIRGPWGSQWPHCHHRVQRKWRRNCSREINTKCHTKL